MIERIWERDYLQFCARSRLWRLATRPRLDICGLRQRRIDLGEPGDDAAPV